MFSYLKGLFVTIYKTMNNVLDTLIAVFASPVALLASVVGLPTDNFVVRMLLLGGAYGLWVLFGNAYLVASVMLFVIMLFTTLAIYALTKKGATKEKAPVDAGPTSDDAATAA